MEDKPKITLIFFCYYPDDVRITSFKMCFDEQIHEINYNDTPTYEIPDTTFKLGKDKTKIEVLLYNSSKELINTIEFSVYYGINSAYIQTDGNGKGYNFEMVFKNVKDIKISHHIKEFISLDDINTKDRKKITILNYYFATIKVNEKEIDIKNLCNKGNPSNFHQISMDLEDDKIIVQPSEKINLPDFDKIMNKKKILKSFEDEIKESFKDISIYKSRFHRVINDYHNMVDFIDYNLNLSKSYLDKYFAEHTIELDTVYRYELFQISYFNRRKYGNDWALYKNVLDQLSKFYEEINKNCKLEKI